MGNICRTITKSIRQVLGRGKSVLLLGPRQVGKTTLLTELPINLTLSLAKPSLRQQYEKNIESFTQEVEALAEQLDHKPLVAVDEVQKVPELMDACQDLIDRGVAQFILTGSSARKLRSGPSLNWLPGRVIAFHLEPLSIEEAPKQSLKIDDLLLYGSLPEIILERSNENREQDLESYVVTYLEEEVRQEALVRKIGDFAKFLNLAAAESGQIANFSRISQDIGVAQTTIKAYYQVLEDCLIVERIEPFLKSSTVRRRIVKSDRYLFFDLGVRRLAAQEGIGLPNKIMGQMFEQYIGLELLKYIRNHSIKMKCHYWRDAEGREVDWVLSGMEVCIPIEVKWTDKPSIHDAKHLKTFLQDYDLQKAYILCRCDRPRKLDENITALPWQQLCDVFKSN
ncbi:MAG: AAA family ATPase [Gammaproteobacteria bacterium]|nr:AAA family ATPase [Gammaproteobacteria bacterium]